MNFKGQNQIFISAIDKVNYLDLLKYLKPKMYRTNLTFPKGTIFYLLTGIHHDITAIEDGKPGRTDLSLLSQFHQAVRIYLRNFCGHHDCKQCQSILTIKPCSSSIWMEMDYRLKVLPLYTTPQSNKTGKKSYYELSEDSKLDLDDLSKDLCDRTKEHTKPTALIFASCYSMYSNITDILRANGILTIMNMSKERGEITEGKAFHLDEDQQDIISQLSQVVSDILHLKYFE